MGTIAKRSWLYVTYITSKYVTYITILELAYEHFSLISYDY